MIIEFSPGPVTDGVDAMSYASYAADAMSYAAYTYAYAADFF